METLEQILIDHASKYPLMQPTDAVKLIYQNEFGGGHLIRDLSACKCFLYQEYANIQPDSKAALLEDIGNGMARVMLNALDCHGYHIDQLFLDFFRSSQDHQGNLADFLVKLDTLRKVCASGIFSFTSEELECYLEAYKKDGYPMVSHSEQYRQAYKPSYRVVIKKRISTALCNTKE